MQLDVYWWRRLGNSLEFKLKRLLQSHFFAPEERHVYSPAKLRSPALHRSAMLFRPVNPRFPAPRIKAALYMALLRSANCRWLIAKNMRLLRSEEMTFARAI